MKTIFFDVDTQNDFMNKDGALYVTGAELIKPNLEQLTDFAKLNNIPVLGNVDRHFGTIEFKEREGELQKWGGPFPNHCMHGEIGQLKIYETTLELGNLKFEDSYDSGLYIPHMIYHGFQETPIPKNVIELWKTLNKINPVEILEEFWADCRRGIDDLRVNKALEEINLVYNGKKKPKKIQRMIVPQKNY